MAAHSSILAWKIPWTEDLASYNPQGRKESEATDHARKVNIQITYYFLKGVFCRRYMIMLIYKSALSFSVQRHRLSLKRQAKLPNMKIQSEITDANDKITTPFFLEKNTEHPWSRQSLLKTQKALNINDKLDYFKVINLFIKSTINRLKRQISGLGKYLQYLYKEGLIF